MFWFLHVFYFHIPNINIMNNARLQVHKETHCVTELVVHSISSMDLQPLKMHTTTLWNNNTHVIIQYITDDLNIHHINVGYQLNKISSQACTQHQEQICNQDISGRTILKFILQKCDVRLCIGIMQLRTGTSGQLVWTQQCTLSGKFLYYRRDYHLFKYHSSARSEALNLL